MAKEDGKAIGISLGIPGILTVHAETTHDVRTSAIRKIKAAKQDAEYETMFQGAASADTSGEIANATQVFVSATPVIRVDVLGRHNLTFRV